MTSIPARRLWLPIVLGVGAFMGLIGLGARTPETLVLAFVASFAAGVTALLVPAHPTAAVALIFALATVSRTVIELPIGRVRLEQPAIIAVLVTLTLTRGWPRHGLRQLLPIVGAFAIYLGILVVASALHAPEPAVSARMILWTTLSMAGGIATFALLVRRDAAGIEGWFTATGLGHALVGIAVAAAFLLVGPVAIPGLQRSPGEVPKVAGLAWEANLFASMLGAIVPFALDRYRAHRSWSTAIPLVVLVVGLGLGVTRGAYIGLAAGLLSYLAIVAYRSRTASGVLKVVPVLVLALVMAPSIAAVSLPSERDAGPPAVATPAPHESGDARPTSSSAQTPAPSASATPRPSPTRAADTLAFRVDRIPVALADLAASPWIGLGAATFGQRHEMPYRAVRTPDYIGMLALVALYETGIVGATALALGFLLALRLLLRSSRHATGTAAAYAASLVVLLVAYQATNALFFSINWIILGAALAIAVRPTPESAPRHAAAARHAVAAGTADQNAGLSQ